MKNVKVKGAWSQYFSWFHSSMLLRFKSKKKRKFVPEFLLRDFFWHGLCLK